MNGKQKKTEANTAPTPRLAYARRGAGAGRWWQLIIKDKVKNILLLLLMLGYSSFGICQSELSVTPVFCQSWKEISNIEHDIELYRNGELITKEFYPINDFTAINLKKGKYLLKYKSIFDQEFQREINLDGRKKSIEICIDDYRETVENTFVEELDFGDTLEIWAYQTGCEYIDFGKLQLIKKIDGIEALLIKDGEVNSKILNDRHLSLIKEIEHRIHLIKMNENEGYLRTNHYEIKLNRVEKVKTSYWVLAIGYELKLQEIFGK